MRVRLAALTIIPASLFFCSQASSQYLPDSTNNITPSTVGTNVESSLAPRSVPVYDLVHRQETPIVAQIVPVPIPSPLTSAAPVPVSSPVSRSAAAPRFGAAPVGIRLATPLAAAGLRPVSTPAQSRQMPTNSTATTQQRMQLGLVSPSTTAPSAVSPASSVKASIGSTLNKPNKNSSSVKSSTAPSKATGLTKFVPALEPLSIVVPSASAHLITKVPTTNADGTDNKSIALTFDDGPSPVYTPQVLALLKEHGIKATFCVVGRQVKKHPELVQQIVAEGHKIANHSMNHDEYLPSRSVEKLKQEVLAEKELIESVVPGVTVDYFRAPGGNWNLRVRKMAVSWGMKPLGWSIDTKDWQQPGTEAIVSCVKNRIHSGAVILMHDGGGNRSQSVAALKQFIPTLKDSGYKFVVPQ